MGRRFYWAYALLGMLLFCAATVAAVSLVLHPAKVVAVGTGPCPVITSDTPPDVVDRCIGGKLAKLGKFPASDLGLPADGYCEDRTNGSSWRVIKCMGTQPESQP